MTKYTSVSPRRGRRRCVYLAAPIPTYRTSRYAWALAQVREQFPDHELLSARDLYVSTEDWLAKWPTTLPTLDALVFIAAADRTIGAGVFREIVDARSRGLPVWHLSDSATLIPLPQVHFHIPERCSAQRCARVCSSSECGAAIRAAPDSDVSACVPAVSQTLGERLWEAGAWCDAEIREQIAQGVPAWAFADEDGDLPFACEVWDE